MRVPAYAARVTASSNFHRIAQAISVISGDELATELNYVTREPANDQSNDIRRRRTSVGKHLRHFWKQAVISMMIIKRSAVECWGKRCSTLYHVTQDAWFLQRCITAMQREYLRESSVSLERQLSLEKAAKHP